MQERWTRAMRPRPSPELIEFIRPARNRDGVEQLRRVNAIVNRSIRYRQDEDGSGDSWAPSQATLKRRAGDCEDIAILKLEALRALGIPDRHLYLTIGRKDRSGLVHAIVLVRMSGQIWILDNLEDRPVSEEEYRAFTPIITFSHAGTWAHGFKIPRFAERK